MVAPAFPFVALRDLDLYGVRAFAKGDGIGEDNAGIVGTVDDDGNQLTEPAWVEGEDYAAADSEAAEEALTGPQRPAASASKAAWVAYAADLHADGNPLGLTEAEADALTRDELIAHIDGQRG